MVLQRLVSSPATLQPVSLGRVHASSLRCILLCKEVFAALVQTGVMRPAKPAHLERFAVVVVMGIDPDAIVFRSPAHLAGLFVQLSRSECPLYGDMGRVLVGFARRQFACLVSLLRRPAAFSGELFSGEIPAGDVALTGLRRLVFTVCS